MIFTVINKEISKEFDYINELERIIIILNFKIKKILKEIVINIIPEGPLIKK